MKTMTCAQMGGPCDTKITVETKEEMMKAAMIHLETMHPEMAQTIKETPPEDPMMVAWGQKFAADWEASPTIE